MLRAAGLALVACSVGACGGTKAPPPGNLTAVRMAPHDKVDVLFMMDDSLGLANKRLELIERFPLLVKQLDDAAATGTRASYHFGVVTSDLGAGPTATGGCTVGGDGGMLQIQPKPATQGPAPAVCASFALSGGERFIDYDQIAGTNNIEGGLSVPDAFSCIASVGGQGCGFEHVLESVYRALHDPPPENAGFLRDDALLVVVYLTDEDDCSAPPDTDLFLNTPEATTMYGPEASFRCTQWGIECDGKPIDATMSGQGNNCAPWPTATGGKLFDTSRYIQLFANDRAHGGLKDDPSDVVLASIDSPPTPFGWTITTTGCPQGSASCPVLDHSCVSSTNSAFFGDPAVRIHDVVSHAATAIEGSDCDTDYSGTVNAIGSAILDRIAPGCLPGALPDAAKPVCTVTVDGAAVHACSDGAPPCWSLQADAACPAELDAAGNAQHERLVVTGAAASATITAACALEPPAVH